MTKPAPLLYYNLTGEFGLATTDPAAWAALTQPEASAGLSFVTNGVVQGDTANSNVFPDDKGFYVAMNYGGKVRLKLQDSDVVCLRSASADADGYHSLVHTESRQYEAPPLTTFTLERVQEAGEWEVNGLRVQRRLFTVGVSYK